MPGKACDKYKGKEKQDCLEYKVRFAKMKSNKSKKNKIIAAVGAASGYMKGY